MYAVGDFVVYGIHGVCTVVNIEQQQLGGHVRRYYVLEPVEQTGTRFMLPIDNPSVMGKVRALMTGEELEQILQSEAVQKDCWIEDENQRRKHYRELITSGEQLALIRMIGTLERHKIAQALAGRKFHLSDENFLRDAKKLVESEISMVLGMEKTQAGAYIREKLGIEETAAAIF